MFSTNSHLINKTVKNEYKEGILVFVLASNGRIKNVGRSISEQSITVLGPTATVDCRK
jgi:hypothetical protein